MYLSTGSVNIFCNVNPGWKKILGCLKGESDFDYLGNTPPGSETIVYETGVDVSPFTRPLTTWLWCWAYKWPWCGPCASIASPDLSKRIGASLKAHWWTHEAQPKHHILVKSASDLTHSGCLLLPCDKFVKVLSLLVTHALCIFKESTYPPLT